MTAPLAPEVENLLERAASLPRGLAFLHLAPLESVAIALGVDARLVERVRRQLEDPADRRVVIEAFQGAVLRWQRGPRPDCFPMRTLPVDAQAPMSPEELIRAAEGHYLGLSFLVEAPLETVAVTFGVHPLAVLEARGLLERRGTEPRME